MHLFTREIEIQLYILAISNYNWNIMEIKIVITKKNKERILKLIDQLVEYEAEGMIMEPSIKTNLKSPEPYQPENFLKELSTFENIKFAEPEIKQKKFGAWGMFNSYAPGKAAQRNPELVKKIVSLVDHIGLEVASPGEARTLLKIV